VNRTREGQHAEEEESAGPRVKLKAEEIDWLDSSLAQDDDATRAKKSLKHLKILHDIANTIGCQHGHS